MPDQFHFIEPLWLLALIPLALLAWHIFLSDEGANPWRRIIDARLLPLLMAGGARTVNRTALWLAAAGWIIAVLALADPTWERKPQPVYQTSAARVVVLDLSRSMEAADLTPSRLVRARYKIEDVLDQRTEGQTGLVVYAGDAFTVTPLTRDVNTIRALLNVLEPSIMPIDGSRADLGLLKADELLRQAGASNGQVLLIADGVDTDHVAASARAAARLRSDGYRVSVLGVGTEAGTPLKDDHGNQLRDAAGNVTLSRLDRASLQALARDGGGQYQSITDSGEGLRTLLADDPSLRTRMTAQTDAAKGWKEQGPLLAVLLLPLAALAFRRNWLLSLAFLAVLAAPPQPAMASTWDDLWLRSDQQAARALAAGRYDEVVKLAPDAARRGSAEYKRGNFLQALENFSQASGANADYNRGNALARLGRYQDAIAAYDQALRENPRDDDARANKAAVEALLKQQPKEQRQEQEQGQQQQDQRDQQNPKNQKNQEGQRDGGGQSAAQQKGQKSSDEARAGDASATRAQNPSAQDAASAKPADAQYAAVSDTTRQKKSENRFAEAVKNLAKKLAGAKADEAQPANVAPGGSAAGDSPETASAKTRDGGTSDSARPLDSEERLAAEQWLRRIPDDPGGLLRRKFLYQYRQRVERSGDAGQ